MVKIVALPLLLMSAFFGLTVNASKEEFKAALQVTAKENGNYRLDSVDESELGSEIRIYRYDDMVIDEIAANAFAGTSFTSIALSNCVTTVNADAFSGVDSLTIMNFTGSDEEYNTLNITYEFSVVNYYAIDEGFINFWNKEVRPTSETNICDITKDTYNYIRELYSSLNSEDKEVVDAHKDLAGSTIKDSIKELNRHFAAPDGANKTEEWNQTGAITLILIIAVIGMTSITIFFLLKTKQIIK